MFLLSSKALRIMVTGRGRLEVTKLWAPHRFVVASSKFFPLPRPYVPKRFVDLEKQSFLFPGPEQIRASMLVDNPNEFIYDVPNTPHIKTVYEVLDHGRKISNDGHCAGMKNNETGEYEWLHYSEVIERSHFVGSALIEMGLKPREENYVGLFASNRTEFLLTLYGCAGYSMVLIPLYDSLGSQNVNFIITQAMMSLVIANNNRNALNVLRSAKDMPFLKTLILMDPPSSEVTSYAQSANLQLLTFAEFEALGKQNKKDLILPQPEDLFCIPYTSGTTGTPKGVMLTHKNIMACLSSLIIAYGPAGRYGGTIVSYLPPAHIYEIMNQVASLYFARRIAFLTPDVKRIFQDVRTLKPEIIPLVPRLMTAFYSKVAEEVKSKKWKWYIFQFAMSRKTKMIRKGIIGKDTIWDKLVFKKIQDALGGNAHMIITTSAPISPEVMTFFRCAAGCYIFEAYGQTEVLASTMTLPHEIGGGSVGAPLPCNHVKLVDVPDMNYFAKNDEGEICYKGENVFMGYFKAPEQTKECIDKDGWHHSGDIGRWLPNGALKIIDRKKHLFKLSQGEYIAPEKVENAYGQSEIAMQVYVDGFSDKDYIVVLLVPEKDAFICWAKKRGFEGSTEELIQSKDVRTEVLRELHKCGKRADLNSLEQAKNLCLTLEPFTVENGLLSPTLKLKRNEARKYCNHLLEKMYKEGPLIKTIKD